jgi:hypothetical protein
MTLCCPLTNKFNKNKFVVFENSHSSYYDDNGLMRFDNM